MTNRTPASAVAQSAEQIDRLLVSIRDQVETMITGIRDGETWSDAGTLSEVLAQLSRTHAFLGGTSEVDS
jgi:hypothetical protein